MITCVVRPAGLLERLKAKLVGRPVPLQFWYECDEDGRVETQPIEELDPKQVSGAGKSPVEI
jgi:hypothetical protein